MSDDHSQVEQQLEELDQKSEECFQKCQIRSALRIAREATRIAKSHSLVIHYMRGLFDQMRFGHGALDPQATREVSVELVLLLEDEEQARRIEPNLDQGHYHWLCSWMSTCAYDNLAEATGMMSGYNSEGMHECIADGIQVCRQTGKLECVKCFREYASDVYLASDDFDMVRHQCQTLLEYVPDGNDNKDRRWSGHHKLARLLILEGRTERALDELQRAMQFSQEEDVYLKLRSKLLVAISLDEASILLGKPRFDWDTVAQELPEKGEWLNFEYLRACNDALALVVNDQHASAIETLTDWDRRLTEQKCVKEWFEVRLRLIAAYLLQGDRKRAESLSKGLEAKADDAQDFLTLRRLQHLLDPATPVSPIAALGAAAKSAASAQAATPAQGDSDSSDAAAAIDQEQTPLGEEIAGLMQRMIQSQEDDDARDQILADILQHRAAQIELAQDAAYLIHISQFLVRGPEEARRVWSWALEMTSQFSDDPLVLNVVAALGHYFRSADPETFADISVEQLEKWFKLSTSAKVQRAKNFARAAGFYFDEGNYGEAERCYSRAFRLDRTDSSIVLPLADLYRQSDRPRDALAVLDLSLREGNDDQMVAWEAAMTSLQLEQFDALNTYLDKFLELGETQTWAHYYKGLALLHLGQYADSLEQLDLEEQNDPPGAFHLHLIRASNLIALDREEEARQVIDQILAKKLSDVDYLSFQGLTRLMAQLWERLRHWPAGRSQLERLEKLMLEAGLSPDEYFDTLRMQVAETEAVYFYRVTVRQPLAHDWAESPACLTGQQKWTEYLTDWGVLAPDEERAQQLVLNCQSQYHELTAEVLDVASDEVEYNDKPGIVWQGPRWTQDEDDDSNSMIDALDE